MTDYKRPPTVEPAVSLERLQWENERINERLNAGAGTFQRVTDQLEELKQKKTGIQWPVILSLIVTAGALWWQAARYPDRAEYSRDKETTQAVQKAIGTEVSNIKLEQVSAAAEIKAIREAVQRTEVTQRKMDDKLDKIVERRSR